MNLLSNSPNCLRSNEPLSRYTSLGIGGPADAFAEPTSLTELVELLAWTRLREMPTLFLGSGTNTLISDRGFRGCVIRLNRHPFTQLHVHRPEASDEVTVTCGAGVSTQRLVHTGVRDRFGPMRTLAGLPGSVGGAIAMNAQGIGALVTDVTVITPEGHVERRARAACHFGYRYADVGGLVIQAMFTFHQQHDEEDQQHARAVLAHRRHTQELRWPSAGCSFKNPSPTQTAGQLIDRSGLKGWHVGGARVSERHANFILNAGHSRSTDMLTLMECIQRRVHTDHGIWLEPEVRIIGERWEV